MPRLTSQGEPRSNTFATDWLPPIVAYALTRVVTTLLLVFLAARHAPEPPFTEAESIRGTGSDLLSLVTYWDGRWYEEIARTGYPEELPREDGRVVQNAWAFYPLFPALVSSLMRSGLSFDVSALVLSLLLGGAAMVVLYRMLIRTTGRYTALLTVTAASSAPTSLVYHLAYTEGLALLLVLCSLWALRDGRYVLSGTFALALALARPITPALAAVIAVLWLVRWRNRRAERFSPTDRLRHAALAVATAAASFLWPLFCGLLTGEMDAYNLTQQAWEDEFTVWRTWMSVALLEGNVAALFIVGSVCAGAWWLASRRGARGWGNDLRLWVAIYPLYIFGVTRTVTSVFRYLVLTTVPAWPLPDVSARVQTLHSRALLLVGVVACGVALQYFWIKLVFFGTTWLP